jgi:hypothetical protein
MPKISDQDKVRVLNKLYSNAKGLRKEWLDERNRELEYLRGEQLIKKRPSYKANTVTNYLFSIFQTELAVLSRRVPEIALKPIVRHAPEWDAYAEFISNEINRVLKANDFVKIQKKFISNMLAFGRGWFKVIWDPKMRSGKGGIRILVPDTRTVYLEPGKSEPTECNYMFEAVEVDRFSLYRRYPNFKSSIDKLFEKPGETEDFSRRISGGADDHGHLMAEAGQSEDTTSVSYIWDTGLFAGDKKRTKVELVESWFFDEETVTEVVEVESGEVDPKTKKPKKITFEVTKQKYPTGRIITFAGNQIFIDKPNPFPEFPYVFADNYDMPGSNEGMSELAQLKAIQELYNVRNNQITDFMNFNLNPKYLADSRAGIDPENWSNRPGELTICNNVDGLKRLDPPPLHAAVFENLFNIKRALEEISGLPEVTKGMVPGDIRSGAAIDSLQEMAYARLYPKSTAIESAIKDLASLIIRTMQRFYVKGVHYYEGVDLKWDGLSPDMFDYDVKAGINLPSSKIAQQQFVQWLYVNEIVDERYVVEHSQLEGKDALIARMEEKWKKKDQLLEQMALQKGAGKPQGV